MFGPPNLYAGDGLVEDCLPREQKAEGFTSRLPPARRRGRMRAFLRTRFRFYRKAVGVHDTDAHRIFLPDNTQNFRGIGGLA
jgi:hypothetical protein